MWDKLRSSLPSKPPAIGLPSSVITPGDSLPPVRSDSPKPSMASSAWRLACEAYRRHVQLNAQPAPAAPFVAFGALHHTVAEILLERSEEIRQQGGQRVMHMAGTAGLLAVYSPAQRIVQLRTAPTAFGQIAQTHQLVVRMMPLSASLLEGAAAQGFHTVSLAALMWHFGQTAVQALDHLPDLQQQVLRIRRFPSLEPASLLLRQLQLVHLLSQGSHHFESLLGELSEDQRFHVCPDLTSLYLTGALSMKTA
jgi:hypothetical protein